MITSEMNLYGRTAEAMLEDARKKGLVGRIVALGWPPLRITDAWERLRALSADRPTTFVARLFPDGLQTTKAYDEYLERYFRFVSDAADYDAEQTIHGLSASNRSCKSCGSHIAVEHVKGEMCPVCGADLRSATVQKTIARWHERIAKVCAQGEEQAVRAGWLGSWGSRTAEGWEFDDPSDAQRRDLLRRYDSTTYELEPPRGTQAVYLPADDYARLLDRAKAEGTGPADVIHALLA